MEKKLNAKISAHCAQFKKDVATKIIEHHEKYYDPQVCHECGNAIGKPGNIMVSSLPTELIEYLYNYPHLEFTKQDLQKRTRVKNTVPYHDRCRAIRANGEQCTRRKRTDEKFCGTHIKGIPHGEITDKMDSAETFKKVQVWAQEISGIIRHLDKKGNIYDPQDIYQGIKNPKVIAKYINNEGVYTIQ